MGKQKQRGHGEGSLYQRPDGRWVAQITLDNGRRKYLYGKTRKEVADKLQNALHEQQQGMLAIGPRQTVKQYLEHWLEHVHKLTVRVSTYDRYHRILNNHILPTLGHIQLQKLTPQHIQALYAQKSRDGLAPKTIKLIHSILHKGLKNAVQWGLVARNVCDSVSLPRQTKHEVHTLTKEQAQKLLETAKGHRLEALLTLALATGMRRGELIGLRWRDIDFENGSLQIQRSVLHLPGRGFIESEPKTAKGRRKIIQPQFVIDVLKQHRAHQLEARLKAGTLW